MYSELRGGQLYVPATLPPGKECPVPRRLGEPQSRSGLSGQREKSPTLGGNRTPIPRPCNSYPVAVRNDPSRLLLVDTGCPSESFATSSCSSCSCIPVAPTWSRGHP
jgi:hypothetical protein